MCLFGLFTLTCFAISRFYALRNFEKEGQRFAFVLSSFRGNLVIFSLVIIEQLLDKNAFNTALVITFCSIPLFNLLTFLIGAKTRENTLYWYDAISHPLVYPIIIGLAFRFFEWSIPEALGKILNFGASLMLPVVVFILACSIKLSKEIFHLQVWISTTIKVLILPIIFTWMATLFIHEKDQISAFFFLAIAPTALISVPLCHSMDGDTHLASRIIALSTLCSSALAFLYFKFII